MEILLLLFPLGIGLILFGIFKFIRYSSYLKMPFVIGVINDYEKQPVSANSFAPKKPIVRYTVDGVTHRVDGIGFFSPGKQVKVYYDPENPKNSIMEGDNGVGMIIVGFLCFLPFILLVLYAFTKAV